VDLLLNPCGAECYHQYLGSYVVSCFISLFVCRITRGTPTPPLFILLASVNINTHVIPLPSDFVLLHSHSTSHHSTPSFLPLTTNSPSFLLLPFSSSLQSTLTTAIDCCQFRLPFLPFIHSRPDRSVCDGFSTATVFTHPIMYVFTFNHLDQSIMCLFRH